MLTYEIFSYIIYCMNTSWIGFRVDVLNHSFEYRNLGKEKFCKINNIDMNELEKFLNNDASIRFETIFQLARILNIDINNIVLGSTKSTTITFC